MKHIKTILLIVFVFFIVAACNLLDEKQLTSYSKNEVYKTAAGIEGVLAGAYDPLLKQHSYSQTYTVLVHAMSGGFTYNQIGSSWSPIANWEMVAGYANLYSYWTLAYKSISQCNEVIKYTPESPISNADKSRLTGEAYLLRAMVYFDLVRLFGGVPLRLSPVTENSIYCKRSTATDTYARIIQDLDSAEQLMCIRGTNSIGHPHKYAATALKSKVYMVMAGNRPSAVGDLNAEITENMLSERYLEPDINPDQPTNFWLLAYKCAKKVYDDGGYSLVPNFAELWNVKNKNTSESIIELYYSATSPGASASIGRVWLLKSLKDYSPNVIATGVYLGALRPKRGTYAYFNDYDPRKEQSFITGSIIQINPPNPDVTLVVYPGAGNSGVNQFPMLKKYVDKDVTATGYGNESVKYLRYAEILLILAESVNEIAGPELALPYVNKVLKRARESGTLMTYPTDWNTETVSTKPVFRSMIMEERFRELCGEFNEFSDYRRRGLTKFKQLLEYQNQTQFRTSQTYDVLYKIDDPIWLRKYMLMPIPQTEINENVDISVTDQNFGY